MIQKLKLEELNRKSLEDYKTSEKMPVIVILDNIRSMNNVGSVFRTADAFLVEKILLCGITPTPPHREIQKTALGATESVDWEYEQDITNTLLKIKKAGYKIIGIEQTNQSQLLHEYIWTENEKLAIVFGNEVEGISDDALAYCDVLLEIPQAGTKHSLNISVCAGMVIWEVYKHLLKS